MEIRTMTMGKDVSSVERRDISQETATRRIARTMRSAIIAGREDI